MPPIIAAVRDGRTVGEDLRTSSASVFGVYRDPAWI